VDEKGDVATEKEFIWGLSTAAVRWGNKAAPVAQKTAHLTTATDLNSLKSKGLLQSACCDMLR
jgi:hypothetical protein